MKKMGRGVVVMDFLLPGLLAWLCVTVAKAQLKGQDAVFGKEEGYDAFEPNMGSPVFRETPPDGYDGYSAGEVRGVLNGEEQDLMEMSSDAEGEDLDKDSSADVQRDVAAVTTGPSEADPPSSDPESQGDPEQQQSRSRPLLSCGKSSMMLKFSVRRFSRVYLLKGKMAPLLVTSLPKHCGHKVWTTRSWLVLVASYKGCYIRTWLPLPKHHRRFHIQTFQFLDSTSYSYINEEIYFMCSTELCLPSERQCVEGCFDGRKIPVLENPDADRRCVRTPCPGKDEGPRD
nr:PREDICTED: uncharacterized protein LOC107077222 [Lepisosteus oculatus]